MELIFLLGKKADMNKIIKKNYMQKLIIIKERYKAEKDRRNVTFAEDSQM